MSNKLDKRNAYMNCNSSKPDVNVEAWNVVSSSVVVDRNIVYATANPNRMLTVYVADAAKYRDSKKFADLNQWRELSLKDLVPASAQSGFIVDGVISTVALDGLCYVFWRSPDGAHRAMRITFGDKISFKFATIRLDEGQLRASDVVSNFAAFRIPGDEEQLKGKIGIAALVQTDPSQVVQLATLVLTPSELVNGAWMAENLTGGQYANIDVDGSLTSGGYTRLTAGWVNQGKMQVAENDPIESYVSLVVCCASSSSARPLRSYGLPLYPAIDTAKHLLGGGSPISVSEIDGLQYETSGSPATLCNTPDGMLLVKYADKNQVARTGNLVLNRCQPGDPNHGKPGLYSPAWQIALVDPDGLAPSIASGTAPCSVFLPLRIGTGASPCEVPDPKGETTMAYGNCRIQKHVECMITSLGNHPTISTFYWGDIFLVPDYITADILDEYRKKMLLTLVADSFPYPVPDKRVWGQDSPSGMINWLLCTYEYLVTKESSASVQNDISGAAGYRFSSSIIVLGWGAEVDNSLSTGYQSILASEKTRHVASTCSVTTKGLPIELGGTPAHGNDAELFISPEGAIFGNTPISRIGFDLVVVRLRDATTTTGSVLMKAHPIATSAPTAISADYATYAYSPGDLSSYQEQRINTRMYDLFASLSEEDQRDFIINGEDFRSFYTSSDYLDKVVSRFGNKGFGPKGDSNYLEFSFSETSIMRGEYQDTSSFRHAGRWFLDTSFYAGLASHSTLDFSMGFLGILSAGTSLMEQSTSFLVGVDFSGSYETSTGGSESWGITLGEYLNPLAPGEAYTARMYFLKPSPLWARELKHFGFPSPGYASLPNLDLVNSAPTRVLFTVPYVSDALKARIG